MPQLAPFNLQARLFANSVQRLSSNTFNLRWLFTEIEQRLISDTLNLRLPFTIIGKSQPAKLSNRSNSIFHQHLPLVPRNPRDQRQVVVIVPVPVTHRRPVANSTMLDRLRVSRCLCLISTLELAPDLS